jgi:hypothetical protein
MPDLIRHPVDESMPLGHSLIYRISAFAIMTKKFSAFSSTHHVISTEGRNLYHKPNTVMPDLIRHPVNVSMPFGHSFLSYLYN